LNLNSSLIPYILHVLGKTVISTVVSLAALFGTVGAGGLGAAGSLLCAKYTV
jgi:ABC-type methionine transport system permease subunit